MRLINTNVDAFVANTAVVIVTALTALSPIISATASANRKLSDLSTGNRSDTTILSTLHLNSDNTMAATYEQVKDVPNHPEIYLIDVRNPDELAATGIIPASLNIPLPDLDAALRMKNEDFKEKYGRAKPSNDAKIIFTCRSGRRAQDAVDIAKKAGFTNLSVYHGSWLEWAEKKGLAQ